MGQTYDKIFRQVALHANQIETVSASALQTSYQTSTIGQTELGDRAVEFPFESINDGILRAGDKMIGVIGMNRKSPYRPFFHDVTGSLASGAVIPLTSTNSKTRVGHIGDVRDASSNALLKEVDSYAEIESLNTLKTNILKKAPHFYFYDGVRIFHTRTNVVADVVVWQKNDQIALMESSPRGQCPFPEELHAGLVAGALSEMFRGSFNTEQAEMWRARFNDVLAMLGGQQ